MGNTKSQPRETPAPLPKGDIHVPSNIFRKQATATSHRIQLPKYGVGTIKTIEQPRIPCVPETRQQSSLPYNTNAYQIWRNHMDTEFKPNLARFEETIVKQATDELDLEKQLHVIKLQRTRVESEMYSNKESPKPRASKWSISDFSGRYPKLRFIDRKYFFPKPERPELTDDMLKRIEDAARPQPPQDVLVQIDGVDICRKDICTLNGLNWLNDEVINAYIFLIVERGKRSGYKSVYAFNTFFYPKLRQTGYAAVKRWTRKVDIFAYDLLLAPIHLGNHWCLAVIDFTSRTISYYDSLGMGTKGCCDTLLDYLKQESNDKKKQDFDGENWRLIDGFEDLNIPVQTNGSDCGVFACTFAEYITRKAKLTFSQNHMPYFRKKMIYELINKELLQ